MRTQRIGLLLGVLALALLAFTSRGKAQGRFTVIDLGTLGGTSSQAFDINNNGQIVGSATLAGDSAQHAFLYSGGVMTDLIGTDSSAVAINDSGQVIGAGGAGPNSSFMYSNGSVTILDSTFYATGGNSSINSSGQVAGTKAFNWFDNYTAALYSHGVLTPLNVLGGPPLTPSWGIGLNDSGQIAGTAFPTNLDTGGARAFLWDNGVSTNLGTLGSGYAAGSQAAAINSSGQVVGIWYDVDNNSGQTLALRAFLYSGGVMTDLGTPGPSYLDSSAMSINNAGQVVGSTTVENGPVHAFLYSGGVMKDIHPDGWASSVATSINDLGQIVGYGCRPEAGPGCMTTMNGGYRAIAWVESPPALPGAMHGEGVVKSGDDRYHFDFDVREGVPGHGRNRFLLEINYGRRTELDKKGKPKPSVPEDGRFKATTIDNIIFSDDPAIRPGRAGNPQVDTVVFSGRGEWNRHSGYTFEVRAADQGEPGRHRESISIVIRDATGAIVAQARGDLASGNVQSERIKHGGAPDR